MKMPPARAAGRRHPADDLVEARLGPQTLGRQAATFDLLRAFPG